MEAKAASGNEQPTNHLDKPLARLGINALVLVWAAPRGSRRSESLGHWLGADVQHVYVTRKKGWYIAPFKYFFQTIMTLASLHRHRYELVICQNPPVFATLAVYLYSLFAPVLFVIDSHTDALLASFWKWTLPLHRFLSRRAITTMVTNEHLRQIVGSWNADAFVLRDVPNTCPMRRVDLPEAALKVAVVSSAAYDEPTAQILEAANAVPHVAFYITGNHSARSAQVAGEKTPANVHFTGYLPDDEFYGLLDAVHVVMCLTTEDHTHQSGASEALWLGKPIITSDWPLLQAYFERGTIHVDNTAGGIRQALSIMERDLPIFEAEILSLRERRHCEWQEKSQELVSLVQQAMSGQHPIQTWQTGEEG